MGGGLGGSEASGLCVREAIPVTALFQHLIGAAAAGAAESLSVADPVNLVLPPGDTVPVVNNPNTEDRAELVAIAAVAHIVLSATLMD